MYTYIHLHILYTYNYIYVCVAVLIGQMRFQTMGFQDYVFWNKPTQYIIPQNRFG